MIELPCVIFAGGQSRRMGTDKALLPFGQKNLAHYQYDRLKKIFSQVYISTKGDKFDFSAPLIFDKSPIFAPAPALLDVLEKLQRPTFIISVDTPFLHREIIDTLIQASYENPTKDAIVAKTTQLHPLIAIYHPSIIPTLQKAIARGNYKLNAILRQADLHCITFKEEEPFMNLNYPEEFQRALSKL
ncbi:MAG: molybdenum cofactor guanylyltransferase MobA [Epsilonproteobacteria bacterium]|nr:molybdenum cofactor guanylyltransferase MobA [Campylobacterota bacterium]